MPVQHVPSPCGLWQDLGSPAFRGWRVTLMLVRGGLEIRLQASESNMLSGYPPALSARELLSAHPTTTLNRKHHSITSFQGETPRTHVGTKLHTMASCTGLRRLQFFTITTIVGVPTIAPAHPFPVATATATTTERRRRRRRRRRRSRRSRRKARTTLTTVDEINRAWLKTTQHFPSQELHPRTP